MSLRTIFQRVAGRRRASGLEWMVGFAFLLASSASAGDVDLARCLAAQSELGERPNDEELAERTVECAGVIAAEPLEVVEGLPGAAMVGAGDSAPTPDDGVVPGAAAAVGEMAEAREDAEERLEEAIAGSGTELNIELQDPDNPLKALPADVPPHGEGERRPRWQ